MFPDPIWPVVLLALISFADGLLCLRPVRFIAECFENVGWPRRWWWVMAPIKFAAAAGLAAGLWVPYLGAVTSAALVVYFALAVAAHLRARDFGRDLFVNATGMLVLCALTFVFCFALG